MNRLILSGIFLISLSCSSARRVNATVVDITPPSANLPVLEKSEKPAVTQLSEWTCDLLIEKSKDETFPLKNLAALKAKKKCPTFTMDIKKLSDFEKKLYADEIAEIDPLIPAPSITLTLEELRAKLKAAETSADKMKAYKQVRAKEKSSGLRNDYLKTTADLYNWTKAELRKEKSNETRAHFNEAAQLFARTYWTEDQIKKADEVLNDALRQLKGSTSIAELYFLQARMAEEKLDLDKAVTLYDLAAEDFKQYKPKNSTFSLDKILWVKSWILFKQKKWSLAEQSFKALADQTMDISEKSRASFYRARALAKLDKKEESKVVLEKLIKDDFFGYYGLVAYNELGRKLPAISKLTTEKKFPYDSDLSFLKPVEKNIFQDLIKYQETEIAERAVSLMTKNPEQQVNVAIYLAEKGSRYLPLFAGYGKLPNDERVEIFLSHSHLLYPQPYLPYVKSMSEKTSLPTSLIYSIMKQESAFNEKTRSHADAFGLMQMIPRLAKQLSKKFSVDYKLPDDLFKPEINIQLGSFELMEQVKKQSGQLTYVAAAYNAGPGALNGWLKNRNRPDILEFIEEIPYDETRTYVKLIARNKLFYERVSKRDEEVPFPTEFLTIPDPKKDTSAKN